MVSTWLEQVVQALGLPYPTKQRYLTISLSSDRFSDDFLMVY